MWTKILVSCLFVLGSVEIRAADNNSKIVCYYDSRAFAHEGEKSDDLTDEVIIKTFESVFHEIVLWVSWGKCVDSVEKNPRKRIVKASSRSPLVN